MRLSRALGHLVAIALLVGSLTLLMPAVAWADEETTAAAAPAPGGIGAVIEALVDWVEGLVGSGSTAEEGGEVGPRMDPFG